MAKRRKGGSGGGVAALLGTKRKSKGGGSAVIGWLLWPLRIAVAVILPFFLLVRVSVALYEWFHAPAWLALGVGLLLTFALLYYYLNWLSAKLTGKKKPKDKAKRFNLRAALVVVGGFAIYAMLYISAGNAKTSNVQSEYASMHPLLRMAVSVLLIFDRDAVVTDMSRTHADYSEMNLAEKKKSLHYRQSDGHVHAMDLRTNDRSGLRNTMLEWYFRVMGFRTLRHTGTADHLHVSLMVHDNPAAL